MKKYQYFFIALLIAISSVAEAQSAKELQDNARSFMQQGDFSNAILIFKRALELEPKNTDISKDLALTYYLQKDNIKALETIKPLLDKDEADDQAYQIAGNIYKQIGQPKDADKLYRKGIKKIPSSGALYNDLGELLFEQKDFAAIKQWEKGIEVDPSYSKNYYNASKFYYLTADKVWSILYGEIFINMEPLNSRSPEMKNILLEGYKKLFADPSINPKEENKFTIAFLTAMAKQSSVAFAGLYPETLTMIRTRFILDWNKDYADQFPFRLFQLQHQFLQEGLFDAYNQWLFGTSQNLAAYQNWTLTHDNEYKEFSRFQKGRMFKIPLGQFYH